MRQRYNAQTGEFEDDYGDQRYDDEPEPDLQPAGGDLRNDTRDRPAPEPRRYTAEESDFLRRNPGDEGRMAAALGNRTLSGGGSGGDADQDGNGQADAGWSQGAGGQWTQSGGGGGGQPASSLQSAYGSYLGTPSVQSNQNTELTGLIKTLVESQQADKARQDQERKAMREILMGRLKTAQEPVSADSPGIRELIAARELKSQRGAARQRGVLAERMAANGLADSGAFNTGVMGIEEDRTEADADATAEILGGELQSKRSEIQYLLQLAGSTGDAESARTLQAQLAAIDAQLQRQQMSDVNSRFGQDLGLRKDQLGFQKSSFMDDLGYRLLALQLGANQNAGGMFF